MIFFLPWQGSTIAGTTDAPAPVESNPHPSEEDIRWILEEVRGYLSPDVKVRRGDVLSAWSGLRPLVRDPSASKTEGLVRNHMIYVSDSGLLTIAGGKWTTYRVMAEETIDKAVETFGLQSKVKSGCITDSVRLLGSDGWSRNMFIGLIQTVSPLFNDLSANYKFIFSYSTAWKLTSPPIFRRTMVIELGQSVRLLHQPANGGPFMGNA